jgi:GR25 family glycosyltransferase involved in LPS biosynthesis
MKCRFLHLLIDPKNNQKEKQSFDNIQSFCKEYSYDYLLCMNSLYKDLPPRETCNRPNDINMEPGGKNLSPAHYGCYTSHKKVICLPENSNYDCIFVFEDAVIDCDFSEFNKAILKFYEISKLHELDLFNFGNNLGPGYTYDKDEGNYILGNHFFIPAHSYMILNERLKIVQFKLNTCKWDAFDLWITKIAKLKTGCSKKIYTKHCSGYSYVDKCIKNF